MNRLHFVTAFTITSLALAAGCGPNAPEGRLPVFPAAGLVTVNGQPAEGVSVVLIGAAPELRGPGTPAPEGTTDPQGRYVLRSYEPGDGAPAGEFQVMATWIEPLPPDADPERFTPNDRLKGKYADPTKSGLKVTIPDGGGDLPTLELSSSAAPTP